MSQSIQVGALYTLENPPTVRRARDDKTAKVVCQVTRRYSDGNSRSAIEKLHAWELHIVRVEGTPSTIQSLRAMGYQQDASTLEWGVWLRPYRSGFGVWYKQNPVHP